MQYNEWKKTREKKEKTEKKASIPLSSTSKITAVPAVGEEKTAGIKSKGVGVSVRGRPSNSLRKVGKQKVAGNVEEKPGLKKTAGNRLIHKREGTVQWDDKLKGVSLGEARKKETPGVRKGGNV